jgi:hypothetical protein
MSDVAHDCPLIDGVDTGDPAIVRAASERAASGNEPKSLSTGWRAR